MRQTYRAGEKLFVDFAGPTMLITYQSTGEVRQASIFVAVLGYSNYDRRKSRGTPLPAPPKARPPRTGSPVNVWR